MPNCPGEDLRGGAPLREQRAFVALDFENKIAEPDRRPLGRRAIGADYRVTATAAPAFSNGIRSAAHYWETALMRHQGPGPHRRPAQPAAGLRQGGCWGS